MSHQSQNQIWNYIEDRCPPEEARAFEAHLQTCKACQQSVQAARLTLQAMRGLPRYAPSADLSARIQVRLAQPQPARSSLLERLTAWFRPQFAWGLGVAAMLFIGGWFLFSNPDRPVHPGSNNLTDEYADACVTIDHALTAMEEASDPTTKYILAGEYTERL